MEESIKAVSTTSGKGDKKVEKRISVEEISNGFIITENKDFKDAKGNWQYETTKAYSKTNPLADSKLSLKNIIKGNMPGA